MSFGKQTVIQPTESQIGPAIPEFRSINQIPKATDSSERFDIIGVALYIEESGRAINTRHNRETLVREIVLTDHSSPQPLTISLWNDLAEGNGGITPELAAKFSIVGLAALRATNFKGFSLTSTMSTSITINPVGDRSDALSKWAAERRSMLMDRQKRVTAARVSAEDVSLIIVKALKEKGVHNTLQEDRYRLKVIISDLHMEKVNAYLGCSSCASRSDYVAGQVYDCHNCLKKDCTSVPRVTFSCEVSDETGTLPITMFTADSERLFRMTAPDIYKMKYSGECAAFEDMQAQLTTEAFFVNVGPKTTLTTNNILQWILKRVLIEEVTEQLKLSSDMAQPSLDAALQSDSPALVEPVKLLPNMPGDSAGATVGVELPGVSPDRSDKEVK